MQCNMNFPLFIIWIGCLSWVKESGIGAHLCAGLSSVRAGSLCTSESDHQILQYVLMVLYEQMACTFTKFYLKKLFPPSMAAMEKMRAIFHFKFHSSYHSKSSICDACAHIHSGLVSYRASNWAIYNHPDVCYISVKDFFRWDGTIYCGIEHLTRGQAHKGWWIKGLVVALLHALSRTVS